MRGRFQGLANVVRFNWPYYVAALAIAATLIVLRFAASAQLRIAVDILLLVGALLTATSLVVTWYIYDHSNLYTLDWLETSPPNGPDSLININAGFDETSALLRARYPQAKLTVLDFFNPENHTEASLTRARKAYPPFPGTKLTGTAELPLDDSTADSIFVIFAAHEIREPAERVVFMQELRRCLRPDGKVIVVEHLRDAANLLAYNLGAFHFHSRATWLDAFEAAGLDVENEKKLTPFVSAFFLTRNGTSS